MKNSKAATNFLTTPKSNLAAFLLEKDGHFLPIGKATDALLKHGENVTITALIAEMEKQTPSALRDRGICHLQDRGDDGLLRK